MAGKDTSLTYSLYGKDVSATGAMRKVGKETESVGKQFSKMGKVAAASLAVAGAAAAKFAYDSLQAAADDEKSQKQLALALQNTTKATQAQVKQSEDFISKLQLSYGIADDKLRPALSMLARGTGNLTESQNLLGLAMDVSAGTGKDLTAVSGALVKAHNGNLGALKRLGIPLSESIVKSKDFNAATKVLAQTFGGAAKTNAETFSGRLAIMQQHLNESKEQIGYALMPTMTKFADYLVTTVVPNVQGFVDGLTGVKNSGGEAMDSIYKLGQQTRGFFKYLGDHQTFLGNMAKVIAAIFIGSKAYAAVNAMIGALTILRTALALTGTTAAVAAGAEAAATGGGSLALAMPAIIAIGSAFGVLGALTGWTNYSPKEETAGQKLRGAQTGQKQTGSDQAQRDRRTELISPASAHADNGMIWFNGSLQFERPWMHSAKNQKLVGLHTAVPGVGMNGYRAVGGSVMGGSSYMVGENGPELFTPFGSGRITPHGLGGGSGMTVVVNVQGSVVHEKDLAVTVRDNIAQLMRRRGLNPAILGV